MDPRLSLPKGSRSFTRNGDCSTSLAAALTAVPRDGAQAMIESRTSRSGRVDRSVVIVYTIKVVSAGTTKVNYNNTVKELKGRVTSAKAYAVGDRQPVSEDALLASWPADS